MLHWPISSEPRNNLESSTNTRVPKLVVWEAYLEEEKGHQEEGYGKTAGVRVTLRKVQ